MTEARADLGLALDAARVAGEAVMRRFRTDTAVRHKGPGQPVTEADLEADEILRSRLLGARPDYGWLSEETVDDRSRFAASRVWVVDPLDGTRSFIAGYREFGVSVGLVEAGDPVVGVVYNPARREVFWAVRGAGAYRVRHWAGGTEGAVPLAVVEPGGDRPALLASRSEVRLEEFAPFAESWLIRPLGSTAYKLACVACGIGHAYLSRGPKSEWDVVAGDLLVRESGGAVTDLRGTPLRYNRRDPYVHGMVAGPTALHGSLIEAARGLPAPRLRRTVHGEPGTRDRERD